MASELRGTTSYTRAVLKSEAEGLSTVHSAEILVADKRVSKILLVRDEGIPSIKLEVGTEPPFLQLIRYLKEVGIEISKPVINVPMLVTKRSGRGNTITYYLTSYFVKTIPENTWISPEELLERDPSARRMLTAFDLLSDDDDSEDD